MRVFIIIALIALYIWGEFSVFASTSAALGDFGPLLVIISTAITAAIGVRLFRIAGRATMRRFAEAAQKGRPPVFEIADGGAIALAAGLLLLPGYITDAMGLVLFIPGLRGVIGILLFTLIFAAMPKAGGRGAMNFGMHFGGNSPHPPQHGEKPPETAAKKDSANITIEGEFRRKN